MSACWEVAGLRGHRGGQTSPPPPSNASCRHEAPGRSSQGKQPTFASISESICIPELPQEMHTRCTPQGFPCSPQPLPAPQGGWGARGGGRQHGSARPGWAAPAAPPRSRGTDAAGAAHGALHSLMQLEAWEKPPPLGFGEEGGGGCCCPVARQQLPVASPPPSSPGPGARRATTWAAAGARVPLPEPGADGWLRERSGCSEDPRALGSCALGLRLFVPSREAGAGPAPRNPSPASSGGGHPERPTGPRSPCEVRRRTRAGYASRGRSLVPGEGQ